jgi:drug/metabolite transporter (DMT)-like permease
VGYRSLHARSSYLLVGLALLAVYLIWGSTYLAIRVAVAAFPPFYMAGTRLLVAGALLLVLVRLRGGPLPTREEWRSSLVVGGLLLVGGNGGVVFAEQTVASGLTALAVATVALWTALFAGIWGQWPGRLEWVGLGLGFAGIVVLNLGGNLRASPAGAVALLVGTMSWAAGSVWSRRLRLPAGLMAPAAEMLAGGALLMLLGWSTGEELPRRFPLSAVAAVAYLVVFGSLVGFSAYMYLLAHVRPTIATSYAYVNPVIAVALGVLFAGEEVGLNEWIAMPVVLAGVGLVILARGRRVPRPPDSVRAGLGGDEDEARGGCRTGHLDTDDETLGRPQR